MESLINKITDDQELLHPQANGVLTKLAQRFSDLQGWNTAEIFSKLGDHSFWDAQYMDPTGEQHGMHTMDAFRCLVDTHRTAQLIQGIVRTIRRQVTEHKGPVTAIDAGTGTGILAMAAVVAGCEKVYALEINPSSAQAARDFIYDNGLHTKIEVIKCDATKVDLHNLQANLLLSENLSNGLMDEPQYLIIEYLSRFLATSADIIPYAAQVFASLAIANTKDYGDKTWLASRKLPNLKIVSPQLLYANVVSKIGMEPPSVEGVADFPDPGEKPNTLVISTRFQIDKGPDPIMLEPDSAEFLGKSGAFRVYGDLKENTPINLAVSYPVGIRKDFLIAKADQNLVTLYPAQPDHV